MPLQDEDLVRRAAAGDHAAFAELYDRYERRAYNLCYRITGSADDAADATQETFLKVLERLPKLRERELNFAAYVMTVARNASYDAIERRKRSAPTGEIHESAVPLGAGEDHELPERVALREAHQEQIRLANESLPERQREVLALRELSDLSYDEVARIMGMNQNSVAQLISRARINLRDGLRQTALGSVASASPDCDRALPLLAKHQDGLLEDPWLVEHLMACGACRVRLEAMEEAAVAYRQWILLVPALWLREDTAEAAERVNDGWNRSGGRRVLAGAAAALVVLLALVTADLAQSPTREAGPAPEADPVLRVTAAPAPKPVERRARPAKKKSKPRAHAKKKVVAAPKATQTPAPEPLVTAQVVSAPGPVAPKPRPRPRREPIEAPDPPPVVEPAPVNVVSTTPVPPAVTPDGTSTTPTPTPCPGTSIAGCPPPPRPPVVCRTCTIVVAPTPPPPRRPLRVIAPGSTTP